MRAEEADGDMKFTSFFSIISRSFLIENTMVCLSNRIKMLKGDIYICRVSIFMSKLQYTYPNCNIYIFKL